MSSGTVIGSQGAIGDVRQYVKRDERSWDTDYHDAQVQTYGRETRTMTRVIAHQKEKRGVCRRFIFPIVVCELH